MSPRHAFDSLVLREDRLFGWGWWLDPRGPARRIVLVVKHADGSETRVRCQPSGHRPDLAEAYADIPHAAGAGFLVQARLRGPVAGAAASLDVEYADGHHTQTTLAGFPGHYLGSQGAVSSWRGRWLVARALLARGNLGALLRRARDMLARRLAGRRRRAEAQRSRTTPTPAGQPAPWVVFDHAMGGGANHFRDECLAHWRAEGRLVSLLTPHLPTQAYQLRECGAAPEREAEYGSLAAALDALPAPGRIVLNSLVSFDDPGRVLDWVAARQAEGVPVTYYLHDYHPACPAWTLVDDTGRYCGLPAYERCARCLPANDAPFLGLLPDLDLPAWRQRWGAVLAGADEIVAFSQASLDVLRQAFPQLPADRLHLRPHDTSYIRPEPVQPDFADPLVIAVVGQINRYKGADIVRGMAVLIERERLPARLVVVGTLDDPPVSPVLRITGPYRAGELPELLRRERTGVCLLPSIWHETFSYVTSELMAHGLPLAVFDLGAPAERVRGYARGAIIPAIDARAALDALFALRARLAAAAPRLESR
ncbi:glycosyltransferase [Arenimonas sp.]|uniref:glycosyltransferase n=1 Tax=Arenimonas sp. TaxID=1872635 RepID=UPI0035B3A9C5